MIGASQEVHISDSNVTPNDWREDLKMHQTKLTDRMTTLWQLESHLDPLANATGIASDKAKTHYSNSCKSLANHITTN